jgi:hypothetical protein
MFFSYSLIVIITYIYNQIGYLCFVIVTIASCLIKINKIVKNIYSGIVCAFDQSEVLRPQVLEMSKIIRHRDQTGVEFTVIAIMSSVSYC